MHSEDKGGGKRGLRLVFNNRTIKMMLKLKNKNHIHKENQEVKKTRLLLSVMDVNVKRIS